ncbi:IS630 family transposase [Candidatus Gottesmanbacteria bacterium]|nr:IS630 family transposase [Candidatus Gottesmanbacteria bacterium]
MGYMTMYCPKLTTIQIGTLKDLISHNNGSSREIKRAQAIIMIDKEKDVADISEITGFGRSQIFELRKKYLLFGITAIEDKRKKSPNELLTRRQRMEVIRALQSQTPNDYGYDCDYWTTGILADWIKRQYDVQYKSKTSFYLIFRQAKFTFHKPGRVYEKRNEQEVKQWQEKTKPVVEKAMRESNTVVLVEDEMSLSAATTIQKIWLPQGQYPKIEVSSRKESRSIYGFLNIKTKQERAFKTKWQNMYITCDVLKKLRKIYPTQKILLIWDQGPWHRGSKAQEFIKADDNIQTIYFPRGAPEENPQEHVWKNGRSQVSHNRFIQKIDATTDEFVHYLNSTQFPYSFLDL